MHLDLAARSKAWVYGRSLAGIAGSNPTGGRDVCLLWVLRDVRWRSLRQTDHSSRGVLPSMVYLMVLQPTRGWSTVVKKNMYKSAFSWF